MILDPGFLIIDSGPWVLDSISWMFGTLIWDLPFVILDVVSSIYLVSFCFVTLDSESLVLGPASWKIGIGSWSQNPRSLVMGPIFPYMRRNTQIATGSTLSDAAVRQACLVEMLLVFDPFL